MIKCEGGVGFPAPLIPDSEGHFPDSGGLPFLLNLVFLLVILFRLLSRLRLPRLLIQRFRARGRA